MDSYLHRPLGLPACPTICRGPTARANLFWSIEASPRTQRVAPWVELFLHTLHSSLPAAHTTRMHSVGRQVPHPTRYSAVAIRVGADAVCGLVLGRDMSMCVSPPAPPPHLLTPQHWSYCRTCRLPYLQLHDCVVSYLEVPERGGWDAVGP